MIPVSLQAIAPEPTSRARLGWEVATLSFRPEGCPDPSDDEAEPEGDWQRVRVSFEIVPEDTGGDDDSSDDDDSAAADDDSGGDDDDSGGDDDDSSGDDDDSSGDDDDSAGPPVAG